MSFNQTPRDEALLREQREIAAACRVHGRALAREIHRRAQDRLTRRARVDLEEILDELVDGWRT